MATIHLELSVDTYAETAFNSARVELAGFQWFVSGEFLCDPKCFRIQNTKIHCTPVNEKKTLIWSCEAAGKIVAFASNSDLKRSKLWSHSYDFRLSSIEPVQVRFHELFPKGTNFEDANENIKMDVQVDAVRYKLIDLSDPNNQMIQSPDDAAQVDVEGENLWTSKSILSANSPFFKTLFNSDFKEKLTGRYELKEIKLDGFLHFLSLLYGVHVEINDNNIENLLELGDYFQCDVIISHCRHFLFQSAIPIEKKLKWCDRLGLHCMTRKLLETVDSKALKNIVNGVDMQELSYMMNSQIMSRMQELLPG